MERRGVLAIVVQFLIKHILKWLYSHSFVVDVISYPLPSEPTTLTWRWLLSQASSQAAYISSSIHYRSICLCQRSMGRLVKCWSLSMDCIYNMHNITDLMNDVCRKYLFKMIIHANDKSVLHTYVSISVTPFVKALLTYCNWGCNMVT